MDKMKEKMDIKSLTVEELEQELTGMGEKAFRGRQVFQWMHQKLADSFEEMTNLSKELRQRLAAEQELVALKQVDVKRSNIDGTRKYLFGLPDGHVIESVLMKYQHGNSVCISSQAGCRMGCRFCASALEGLARNLKPSEMLSQVYQIQKDAGERVSNVVVMGVGEPLDNYDNLVRFIRLLSDERGLNISQRNVTVSTCGIAPGIERLADEGLSVTLALSLHAPDDEVRKKLMPVASRYALEEVLRACQVYFEKTGRRLSFEYSLIRGVNDGMKDAQALAKLAKSQRGHVNLIPVNPIKERDFVQSDAKTVEDFKRYLERNGVNVTVRRQMGRDINGACGQLRRSRMEEKGR